MADAGKIVITPKGAYSSTKTYEWLDEVSYNGNAYVALKTVTGVTPSDDGVNWRLFMSSADVDANVLVPKFTEASTRSNIVSGENLSTMFGKIKKWFTDLKSHAFKDLVNNLTTSTTGSALDASQGKVLQDEVDGVNRNLTHLEVSDIAGGKNIFYFGKTFFDETETLREGDTQRLIITNAKESEITVRFNGGSYSVAYLVFNGIDGTKSYSVSCKVKDNNSSYIPSIKKDSSYSNENRLVIIINGENADTSVSSDYHFTLYDIQVEEGSTKTDYEPYIPSVKMLTEEVSAQNESLDIVEESAITNLAYSNITTKSSNGITITKNQDGTFTLNGTATSNAGLNLYGDWGVENYNFLEKSKYTMYLDGNTNENVTFQVYAFNNGNSVVEQKAIGNNITTLDLTGVTFDGLQLYIGVSSGTTLDNYVIKPMLVKGENSIPFVPCIGQSSRLVEEVVSIKNDLGEQKKIYSESTINVGRQAGTTVGDNSTAEGADTEASGIASHSEGTATGASGDYSHAEGNSTTASRESSHAEGFKTTASGSSSHAEGNSTTASGSSSHAEGNSTTASGSSSHAEGQGTKALDKCSHAEGIATQALKNQHAQGHYNDTSLAKMNTDAGTSKGTAFVIGNGAVNSPSNAFRVTGNGEAIGKASFASTGADYAEYFEWQDENPNNEDRVGYFVTFADGNLIKKATEGDYVLGIVSGMPCVIGNNDECWMKQFELDEWGRYIYETHSEINEETGEEKEYTFYKVNPDYDSSKEYIHRKERPEWSAVGMIGVLSVYDDGTCQVNGYCKCTNGGIATACERGIDTYRVIARVTDNIVKIVLKS